MGERLGAPPTSLAATGPVDGEPVAALAQATLSDVESLRTTAVSRPALASTGPLKRPWRRFAAYGTSE